MPDRLRGCQMLLVEDNETNMELLLRRLHRRGFRLATARDGGEAVEMALEYRPPLVLMDLEMPVMSGFAALRAIRAAGLDMPVYALTAHATVEIRRDCDEAGFDDFITKPIDFPALLDRIALAGIVPEPETAYVISGARAAGGGG